MMTQSEKLKAQANHTLNKLLADKLGIKVSEQKSNSGNYWVKSIRIKGGSYNTEYWNPCIDAQQQTDLIKQFKPSMMWMGDNCVITANGSPTTVTDSDFGRALVIAIIVGV